MLAIKLKIVGRKNQRTFRVIVQEARAKLGGKLVEDLGWYNPHTNQFKVNKARFDHWISNGAQPTDSVATLLKKVESSEIGSYEAREGRKKKKGPKEGGEPQPEADEPQVQKAEAPAEGEEASVEETPATDGDLPTGQTQEMSPEVEEAEEKLAGEPQPEADEPPVEKKEPKEATPIEPGGAIEERKESE